jgi:GT2 family glycosyltransferase
MELSVVIPTLGRPAQLRRVLDRLEAQAGVAGKFEVIVVADAKETQFDAVDEAVGERSFPARRLQADRPGASAARNIGWRAAEAPLILFTDDDVFAESRLIAEHLEWHARNPAEEVGVLGRLRWADELRVTPFMRWVERGIHFDFHSIEGTDAGWGRFYTANSSVKRALIESVGGFEEKELPYLYEDLDLALRMNEEAGFRLLYNRAAVAEHLHPMDLEYWKGRVRKIAVSERAFVRRHPQVPAYFHEKFSRAAAAPPAKGRGELLLRLVPPGFPWLGRRAWFSAEMRWLQALAVPFLEAWEEAGQALASAGDDEPLYPSGSSPGGPK